VTIGNHRVTQSVTYWLRIVNGKIGAQLSAVQGLFHFT